MKNKEITIYELMGLIKNNQAPKKIKYDNIIYTLNFGRYYSDIKMNYLFDLFNRNFIDTDIPKIKIEILPEENDEWEDIEEINIENEGHGDFIKNEHGTKCGLTKHSKIIAEKVNKLIKNQKYLKEKQDNYDREN